MKTIKDIAYDCAKTLNFANREKHYRYKTYREAGDYWGNIPIDNNLPKNILAKIDSDIKIHEVKFMAFFSDLELKEAPGFNRNYWWDFFFCSRGGNSKIKEWIYLETDDGRIQSYSERLVEDSLNVWYENYKDYKIERHKEGWYSFLDKQTDKSLEEHYKDLDYMVLKDYDRSITLKATRIPFTSPITLKHQEWAYLIKDKNNWFYETNEPLEYILKRALKIDGILTDNQRPYVKEALNSITTKEKELKDKNLYFLNSAILEVNKYIENHDHVVCILSKE